MYTYSLRDESAYSAGDLSINTLDSDEIDLVLRCVDLLNDELCAPAYFLSVLDDVKGCLVVINRDMSHLSEFLELLDELRLGYRAYDISGNSDHVKVLVAGSEKRYERMPRLDVDNYEGMEPTEDVGWFLGLDNEQDWSWGELEKNSELRSQFDDKEALDKVIGVEYSNRELYDLWLPSVLFYPSEAGLFRMCMLGREIRSCCERFDIVSESMAGTLSLQSVFAKKGSTCTEPPYKTINLYLESRLRIGLQNWWSYTDIVRELINTHRFGLNKWNLEEV